MSSEGRRIIKVHKHAVPICQNGKKLLCYSHGNLIIVDANHENKILSKIKFPVDKLRIALSYFSISSRRFGLTSVFGCMVDDDRSLLTFRRHFYLFDWNNKSLKEIDVHNKGANGNVLHFAYTSHGVIWGDYGYNPEKNPMGIFCYDKEQNEVVKLWEFRRGEINHIHNIIEDKDTHRLWVFTGDFNDSAAIFYTDDYFQTLRCAVRGAQRNRSCIAISKNNVLYYATDSSNEDCNGIYKLENGKINKLHDINGSVIYGYSTEDELIFSTTVENQAEEFNNSDNMYRYNLGGGIKDWYVECVRYNVMQDKYDCFIRVKKDFLPMLPFLYGLFRFPESGGGSDDIFMFGQAVKKYDQWLVNIKDD